MIQLDPTTEIGTLTQKWVTNQELWSFWLLRQSISFKNVQCSEAFPPHTPIPKATALEPWLLTPPRSCQPLPDTRHPLLFPLPSHILSYSKDRPLSASFSPSCMQPALPISPAHPTEHVHMEGLNGCWRFLRGGREVPKDIKEESFAAVIAPLYLANHWRIIICEKYIYIKNPLSQPCLPCWLCNEAQGEKWGGKARGCGLCSEARWNTPGDVWLAYLDGRWDEG